MATLICGSLAFDSIATFPGRFADQILPEQLHILNVSFLVPGLRREFGGCAGNIAYNLAALGGEPVVVAAVGSDGARLRRAAALVGRRRPSTCARSTTRFTAQAFIITDLRQQPDHRLPSRARCSRRTRSTCRRARDLALAIIAPDGREAMLRHAAPARRRRRAVHLRSGPGPADVRRRRAAPLRRAGELGRGQRLRGRDARRADRR